MQKEIPSGVMDTYCWIHGTFTLPKLVMEKVRKWQNEEKNICLIYLKFDR